MDYEWRTISSFTRQKQEIKRCVKAFTSPTSSSNFTFEVEKILLKMLNMRENLIRTLEAEK